MGEAKSIIVKVIPKKIADKFVKERHYSHKVAATGLINFGAFWHDQLIGVAQWGRPINKYLQILHKLYYFLYFLVSLKLL